MYYANAAVQQKETGLKEIDCKVVVGKIENPLWRLVRFASRTKDVTCKTSKKCKIAVVANEQIVLIVGCTCGHDLKDHKLKYKDKEYQAEENYY